jgi:hypothetical protein
MSKVSVIDTSALQVAIPCWLLLSVVCFVLSLIVD